MRFSWKWDKRMSRLSNQQWLLSIDVYYSISKFNFSDRNPVSLHDIYQETNWAVIAISVGILACVSLLMNWILYQVLAKERRQTKEIVNKSDTRYLAILQDQFELIRRYKPDGQLIFANDAYTRFFGLGIDEVSKQNIWSRIPPEGIEPLKTRIANITPEQPVLNESITQQARRWTRALGRVDRSRNLQ